MRKRDMNINPNFEEIESILIHLMTSKEDFETRYHKLNQKSQRIFSIIYKNFNNLMDLKGIISYEVIKLNKTRGEEQRNDVMNCKMIKPFITEKKEIFMGQYTSNLERLKQKFKDIGFRENQFCLKDTNTAFYIDCFFELLEDEKNSTMEKKVLVLMKILYVCGKKSVKKQNGEFLNNYEQGKKMTPIKNITEEFIDFMSKTTQLKNSFNTFIQRTESNGILKKQEKEIKQWVKNLFTKLIKIYVGNNKELKLFYKELEKMLSETGKEKIKFPCSLIKLNTEIQILLNKLNISKKD